MILLVFIPLVGFWLVFCLIVSRPKHNYVGVPPSLWVIWTRVATRDLKKLVDFMVRFAEHCKAAGMALEELKPYLPTEEESDGPAVLADP